MIAALSLFQGCTKEKLVTVNEPLELDENSPQYQRYMAERAINFIKLYRFDKLGNTIDRITDPDIKAEVMALYNEYRKRASEEALYFVTPGNDTLYFIPSITGRPADQTGLSINFVPTTFDLQNQRNIINSRGILQGFKIFPNVENVGFLNSLATGLKDLEFMPKLQTFNWEIMTGIMEAAYPDEDVITPTKLDADFSKNNNLETLSLNYIDIADMKFPTNKVKTFTLTYGIFNSNESLDGLAANDVKILYSKPDRTDVVLKAQNIDSLSLNLSLYPTVYTLTNLDVTGSNLLKLDVGTQQVEKLSLNAGLKKLILNGNQLTAKPTLPPGLEELTLNGYSLSDKDLSAAGGLKKVQLDGSFDVSGLVLSQSVEQLTLGYGNKTGSMDFGYLANLKTFETNGAPTLSEMPRLPSAVTKVDLFGFDITAANPTLDLTLLTNLNFLRVYASSATPVTLSLPGNLTEQAVQAGMMSVNGHDGAIILPQGSTIVNAPEWLSDYVYIGNLW